MRFESTKGSRNLTYGSRRRISRTAHGGQLAAGGYPVSLAMVLLVSLVPMYIFIAAEVRGRTLHSPALALDGLVPLQPAWALVYGALSVVTTVLRSSAGHRLIGPNRLI